MSRPRVDLGRAPATAEREVRYEDLDEVIGLAAAAAQSDARDLTVDEMKSVAAQLDIPAGYIEPAIAALEARRREAHAARARRRRRAVRGGAAALAVLAVAGAGLAVAAPRGAAAVRVAYATVEQRRAQVRTVLDRQARVEARLRGDPRLDPASRDAELAGAENRVAIERRRYDEAATRYNANGAGFPASLWVRIAVLPPRAPLSNEVRRW